MRLLIQRVVSSKVTVEQKIVGVINRGLNVLVAFGKNDTEKILPQAAKKLTELRIFSNDKGRFDLSVLDLKLEVLLVPQFTLYADTSKGRRPEFFEALEPKQAKILFEKFVNEVTKSGLKVATGIFGAEMQVEIINDGPVTIMLEFT